MNFAVISAGGKQYLVKKDQELLIDLLPADSKKKLSFNALLVADDKATLVGTPEVKDYKVTAEVVEPIVKGTKLKITKFKAKKRVNKTTGHRQKHTRIKITAIGK